jgi:hypothetical protein
MKYIMTYENKNIEVDFLTFMKTRDVVFRKIKEYLNKYEPNITNIEILVIVRVEYTNIYGGGYIRIWVQDHREHFDHKIVLTGDKCKNLISYVNNSELFINTNKFNL